MITPLVQLSLLERNGQQRLLSQREALRDHISQYIDRRLGDPEFTIDRMTPALNCSKRHPGQQACWAGCAGPQAHGFKYTVPRHGRPAIVDLHQFFTWA
ncbi:helix-turn-helix domain-containing protein [Acidovorax sp. NO-1]|uniref:hypothetical protein n=1 Tax=Acidovorax sp. NO-1 TaxID=512030 RepID=UPI00023FD4EE|nr:hypothetical protein [Acidovorax sp. NO-1]EHL20655.1 helix-turn-helix domain-containing protein [Acidovorax sp. NO-1]